MDLEKLDLSSMRKKILAEEGNNYPSKTYAEYSSRPAFYASIKEFPILVSIQKAHFVMLVKQQLLNKADTAAIKKGLSTFPFDEFVSSEYDIKNEDMYYTMESWMMKKYGDGTGNLHLGRSRNDIGLSTMHIRLRNGLLEVMDILQELHTAFVALAKEYRDLVMVAHTHTQQAQIGTFGHILIGFAKVLERCIEICKSAYLAINISPMGAAAIETSGFNIDRDIVADLLGFDGLVENAYDAISNSDFLAQAACAIKIAAVEVGRINSSLLKWNSQEFDLLRCAPCFVGTSSIMPQKRNPGPLEYVRKVLTQILGDCDAAVMESYNVEYEEYITVGAGVDSAVHGMENFVKVCHLLSLVVSTMGVEKESFAKWARETFSGITEFSDMLVREEGINYRFAHHVAHEIAGYCVDHHITLDKMPFEIVEKSFEKMIGRKLSAPRDKVMQSLDTTYFVKVRTVKGGPAPKPMQAMLKSSTNMHNKNDQWLANVKSKLAESAKRLDAAFSAIK